MNGYKKLWYGGYGKYNYYVVAEDKEQALEVLRDKYNMRALPVDCVEINNIDDHIIIPVLESELNEPEPEMSTSKLPELHESYVSKVKPIDTMNRAELIQLAKDLDIEGKIATFKTEDLREKVGDKLEETAKASGGIE